MPVALTVSVKLPLAAVRPVRPLIWYVEPDTRATVTALVIRFAPPLSVSVNAESVKVVKLIGTLKVTSIDDSVELRGLGETGAIDVKASRRSRQRIAWARDPTERGGDRRRARGQGRGKTACGNRRDRAGSRRPRDLAGQVSGRAIGVGPRSGELLCETLGYGRVGWTHRDRRRARPQ